MISGVTQLLQGLFVVQIRRKNWVLSLGSSWLVGSLGSLQVLALFRSLPKRGNLENAIAFLEETEDSGNTPDAFTCKTLIEGLCLHGKTSSGYEMLQACRGKGIPIEASGYNVVIRGYCNETKMLEADHVLQDMRNHGVAPNANSYANLIHGYCKSGDRSRVLSLHDEMLLKGVKTNCVILSSILQCLCGMDMDDKAQEQCQRFKNSGQRKWGLSLLLSLAIHNFQDINLHTRQLSYSGIADTYLEAKDRARRNSK